ncbi:MAG TPA: hypothetical protein VN253_15435 [Kofleriaceae bacterium]|nr:hypothetical protein [Kofleriaceae bacterium]
MHMNGIPSAIVENPRPPHRLTPERANAIRKIIAVAIITSAAFACWRLIKPWLRSETSKRMEARQDQAREKIGNGLDELFEHQLDAEDTTVELVAYFDVAAELGRGYDAFNCGVGLDDAFKEALGPDVVTFSTLGMRSDPAMRLVVSATLTSSGQRFQLPHASEEYPGIRMSADLAFLGHGVHADVQPAADIEFKHWQQRGILFEKVSASDVASGIMQGTCKQAGYALLEALTAWKRPPPPLPRADPVAECERGFHCRDNAEMLEATDRVTAAKLYAKACADDDEEACLRSADLEVELSRGGDRHPVEARVTLAMACARELAAACARAGQLALLPLEPGKPPSDWQRHEALVLYLRACDLGARDACAAAAPLLEGTAFAEAAPLLTGTASVRSRTFGTIFALRWGQWTKFDRGQPTVWVTSRSARVPDGVIVTPFEVGRLPPGVVAPAGATMVYAVALDGGRGGHDDRCDRCMPSGGDDSVFAMRSFACVCALAPKPRRGD